MSNHVFDEQISMADYNPEYAAFVDKFKPKKTTDDCYTPPKVYDAVRDWACEKYGIDTGKIVRPFYPGGDYERFTYPEGCVVLDNPPFSILSKICEFYLDRNIMFFLFSPSLTLLSGRETIMKTTHIVAAADITYENGAVVHTGFITNLDDDVILRTAPDLHDRIKDAQKKEVISIPKYEYPANVITAATAQKYAVHGIELVVKADECTPIYALDAQKRMGKTIYGAGLLLSDCLAADRLAADRLAADRLAADRLAEREKTKWELSAREREIIEWLNRRNEKRMPE